MSAKWEWISGDLRVSCESCGRKDRVSNPTRNYTFRHGGGCLGWQQGFLESPPMVLPLPKKRCAWQGRGVHYFTPNVEGQIFCSSECQKKDDRERPRL